MSDSDDNLSPAVTRIIKKDNKKEDKKEETKGLSAAQKKLPPALQKAIAAKKK